MNSFPKPMDWEHRLYRPAVIGGWGVEVWNPMSKEWQRSDFDPHWPDDHEAAALDWVRMANQEQRERSIVVNAMLSSG